MLGRLLGRRSATRTQGSHGRHVSLSHQHYYGDYSGTPDIFKAMIDSKCGPTWYRYVGVIRPWCEFAAAASQPFPAISADQVRFVAN